LAKALKTSSRKPLIFGFVRLLSGFFNHDTYPAPKRAIWPTNARRNGGLEKIRDTNRMPSAKKSDGEPDERREKIARLLIL
jgi:hypothetical protein